MKGFRTTLTSLTTDSDAPREGKNILAINN